MTQTDLAEIKAVVMAAMKAALVIYETADDVAGLFTCYEADLVAELLRTTLNEQYATVFLRMHARADDGGDDPAHVALKDTP
jgi:hypothetical protein